MISTTTSSAVSTMTLVSAMGLGAVVSGVGSVALMSFLAAKELVPPQASARLRRISRTVMVGIVPLTMVFIATVAFKIAGILA